MVSMNPEFKNKSMKCPLQLLEIEQKSRNSWRCTFLGRCRCKILIRCRCKILGRCRWAWWRRERPLPAVASPLLGRYHHLPLLGNWSKRFQGKRFRENSWGRYHHLPLLGRRSKILQIKFWPKKMGNFLVKKLANCFCLHSWAYTITCLSWGRVKQNHPKISYVCTFSCAEVGVDVLVES